MRAIMGLALAVGLAGCAGLPMPVDVPLPQQGQPQYGNDAPPLLSPKAAARNFVTVVDRVEPVAEALCRERNPRADCDLQIVIDGQLDAPPNAYQTLDDLGRPVVGFTLALIADARKAVEIAFVLGHENAHHILDHVPRQQQSAQAGALAGAVLGALTGADDSMVSQLQNLGAQVAARRYSKEYELAADALGAEIALRAGYDPVLGAGFFSRLPDPGDEFLGSHPPNAQRQAQVRAVVARLQGQWAY